MRKSIQASKYIASDFITASVTWLLFNLLRYREIAVHEGFDSFGAFLGYNPVWGGQFFIPLFWLLLSYFSGYYNKPFGKSRLGELFTTFLTVLVGTLLVFFILVLNDLPTSFHVYYELFFFLFGVQFVLTYLSRLAITLRGLRKIRQRKWAVDVLVIGTGWKALRIADDLYRQGYQIAGFVQAAGEKEIRVNPRQVMGTLGGLANLMESRRVRELVVAVDADDADRLLDLVSSLYRYKCPVKVVADKSSRLSGVKMKTIYGIPLVDVTENNFSEAEKNIKQGMDKLVSILFLLLLSPLYLYIAYRVKKDSPGSIFFRQERIGYRGEPFLIYKFRTMFVDAEQQGPLLASENDPRITPFGRVMRKYRLDELPQFWNVLKGDMSLVGPRPERKYYIDQIVKEAPFYYLLHNVRPGITSLGMVKYGYAGNVEQMIERLDYDILYYKNMSLALDIKILIYTVITVVTGKGI